MLHDVANLAIWLPFLLTGILGNTTFKTQKPSLFVRYQIGGFDHLQDLQSLQVLRAELHVQGPRSGRLETFAEFSEDV